MNKLSDYLYHLAHGIFKKTKKDDSDIYKLFSSTGEVLDQQQNNIYLLRRQSLIQTATGKGLDATGKDRLLPRYQDETDEQYRLRQLNKYEIAVQAGTHSGIIKAIESLGYMEVRIEPMYLTDPTRWTEISIYIQDGENTVALQSIDIIKKTIMDVKEASALPTLYIEMNAWYLNGTYNLDGTRQLNAEIIVEKFK